MARKIEFYGVSETPFGWSKIMEITSNRISPRISNGWSDYDAIFTGKTEKMPGSNAVNKKRCVSSTCKRSLFISNFSDGSNICKDCEMDRNIKKKNKSILRKKRQNIDESYVYHA